MCARMEAVHSVLLCDFALHKTAERGTVMFLCDTIDKLWYKDLKKNTFYNSVTGMAFLTTWRTTAAAFTPVNLSISLRK